MWEFNDLKKQISMKASADSVVLVESNLQDYTTNEEFEALQSRLKDFTEINTFKALESKVVNLVETSEHLADAKTVTNDIKNIKNGKINWFLKI